VSRFSENAAPSLGLGSSAILPSLLVSDPFHQTLNAAIVDFYVHGDGEQRWCVSFVYAFSYIKQALFSKLKMESGELTSSQCQ
jgi:hypothetical protein